MLYENYRAKMNKLAGVLGVARRFRVLILCVCAAVVATVAVLFAVSGLVYDVEGCPASIAVGESLPYSAGAVFNSVRYEYRSKDSEEWSAVQPARPGEYLVRSVSKSVFGGDRYGAVHTFVITPKTVAVRVAEEEITYGENLTVTAELAYSDKIICDDFIYGDYSAEKTTVQADKDGVSVVDENGADVSGSYIFEFVTSEIKFLKRDITIVAENYSEGYNGSPYSCGGYEIKNAETALAENDYAVVSAVGFDGTVGEFDITPEVKILKNLNGGIIDVTGNYNLNIVSGKLTVEKRPVYITTGGARKTYDGTELSCNDYSLDEKFPLAEGHRIEIIQAPAQKSAGETDNTILFKILDADGNEVTENYSLIYSEYGKLTVDKRSVAILSASDSFIYDGNPHSCEQYYILETDETTFFAEGETAVVIKNTQGISARDYENVLEYEIRDVAGEDVTENYSLILQYGTLTVAPRPVSIKTYGGIWTYDGTAHSVNMRAEVESEYGLLDGHRTYATGHSYIVDVGEAPNLMSIGVYDGQDNNVTLNYKINISSEDAGVLRVIPRPISMIAGSANKIYDGTALVSDEIITANLVEGHTLSGKTSGSQTNYGESPNVIDAEAGFTVVDADGADVTKNYTVSMRVNGVLRVEKRKITVTTETREFIFNGEYNVCGEYSVEGLVNWHTAEASDCASIRNVNESGKINTMTITVYDGGDEVTGNYEISFEHGILSVNPREVFVETNEHEWVYDGDEHFDDGFKVSDPTEQTGLVGENKISSHGSTVLINADTKPNEMQFTVSDGETENYTVTVTKYGDLTVTKRPVTVTTGTKQQVYDDTVLKCETVTAVGLVDGHEVKAELWAGVRYVTYSGDEVIGVYNTATIKICNGSDDVTKNYEITKIWGILTVTKRPVTVTTGTKQQVFDGTALKCDEVTPSKATEFTGLVDGHEAKAEDGASITEVRFDGDEVVGVDNTATIKIYNGDNEVTANYEIEERWGTLTVNPRPVTVTAGSKKRVYDGTKLTCGEVEVNENNSQYLLVEGHTVTAETSGSQTIVGSSPNAITDINSVEILCNGESVTKNYKIQGLAEGTLTVTPRPITVVAGSKEKVYDGYPLTNSNISVKTDGEYQLVDGHKITGTATGSQTEIGKGENKVDESSVVITDKDGAPVTDNYEIKFEDGTLEVKPRPITIITGSDKKVYDGKPLTCKQLSPASDPDLVLDHKVSKEEIVYTGKQTDAGESNNTVDLNSVKIKDGAGGDVTKNYEITVQEGTLKVLKRTVTIKTADDEWEYDGKEHFNQMHSVREAEGDLPLVDGHTTRVVDYAKIKDYGTKENAIKVEISAADGTPVTQNYDIKYDNGTLEVTRRPITVETATNIDKLIYDGTAQSDGGCKVITEGGLVLDHAVRYTGILPTVTDVSDGEVVNDFLVEIFGAEGTVTGNYKITYEYGKIKINPRQITIKAADDTKVYNGEIQYGEKWEVTSVLGLVEGHILTAHTTESSSADCGEHKVTIAENSARVNSGAMDHNYTIVYDTASIATLTITPRALVLTAGSAEKVYDGTPLTCGEILWDNLVDGHTVTAELNGSQTEPGTSANEIIADTVRIYDGEGQTVTANYDISFEQGELTVTEATAEKFLVLQILSEKGGDIYLKNVSYGDYTGSTQWAAAPEYGGRIVYEGKEYSLDYLFGVALKNAGYGTDSVSLKLIFDTYYLPYYAALGEFGYTIQTSDTCYFGDGREYSLSHYFYDYIKEGTAGLHISGFESAESAYRAFVYANYLKVKINEEDTQTEPFLDKIISEQGFNKNDPDIIRKVASFVQNSATYNMNYNSEVDSENTLISFFEHKEGVCRHYATAATLIFRRLGIPARYTGGLHTSVKAGEWTDVYNDSGHAWVEVYLDGLGWVQVEVTGAMPGDIEIDEDINGTILLKPARALKPYDGTPLRATALEENMYLNELIAKGYNLSVTFGGEQTAIGTGRSYINSYTLFDKDGNNVTAYFEFATEDGKLTVTDPEKQIIIYFNTYVTDATYNGSQFGIDGYYYSDTENAFNRPDGVTLRVEGLEKIKLTSAGVIPESEFIEKYIDTGLVKITATDALGRECVFKYAINLSVARRSITVKTNSVTKVYDGKPLKDDEVTVSGAGLVEGHEIKALSSPSITDIGEVKNEVIIIITDADGNDVTENYKINTDYGVLTVIGD